jgi:hypothetical protein
MRAQDAERTVNGIFNLLISPITSSLDELMSMAPLLMVLANTRTAYRWRKLEGLGESVVAWTVAALHRLGLQ